MIGALIGFLSGLMVIFFIALLKRFDKSILYGLTLTAIGFLYVGYTWTDTTQAIINSLQALVFVILRN